MNNRTTLGIPTRLADENSEDPTAESPINLAPIAPTSLDGHFPCFVRHGDMIEDPDNANNDTEKYAIIARNGLRHLTYGIPFVDCKLVTWDNFSALFITRNPLLLSSLRVEIQYIFLNIEACLHRYVLDIPTQHRLDIFISNLLTAYPFLDPENGEEVTMPHKIADAWHMVRYQFEKIDISPQGGLLASLLEEEDRLYAYGLSPISHADAQPILLFMGTSYPSGQGADLNWLYNFAPNHSVGEKHHPAHVAHWIAQRHHIKAIGHSKGGTMAMIYAATYPHAIRQADCLSPTALSSATLARLSTNWASLEAPPQINVYAHRQDPVYYIDRNFLPQTTIYRFGEKDDHVHPLAAHAHYFAGRKNTVIRQYQHNDNGMRSWRRDFLTDVKSSFNWVMFPMMYSKLVYKLCVRKVRRFCAEHAIVMLSLLFTASLMTLIAIAAAGILTPVTAPLAATLSPVLFHVCLSAALIMAAASTTALLPKVADVAEKSLSTTLFGSTTAVALLSCFSLSGIYSLVKSGLHYIAGTCGYGGETLTTPVVPAHPNHDRDEKLQPGSTFTLLKRGLQSPSPTATHMPLRRSLSLPNMRPMSPPVSMYDPSDNAANLMSAPETPSRCHPM